MWYPITSQQATPIAPPKATPTCCTSAYHCRASLDFRRVLPNCSKSGHVSATLKNDLKHLLLWMVGRRIGSAITRSRKTNYLRTCVFLETIFAVSGKFLRRRSSSDRETCWGQWYLNPGRKVRTVAPANPANQQLGWYAWQVRRIKNMWAWLWVGQAWPGGMLWDITPYTHSIFLSWDITCNPCHY